MEEENTYKSKKSLKSLLFTLVFTGLMVVGAQVEVPLGPVPFVLSDFFVLLAGLMLGAGYATLSVGLYLVLGSMGLPVFAGGEGGLEHLYGNTGGYLVGFWVAAALSGWISHRGEFKLWRDAIATLSGQASFFVLGVVWLKFATEMEIGEAIHKGFLAFLIPAGIKFVAVTVSGNLLRRITFLALR